MIVPVKIKILIFLFKKPSAARDGGYRTVHSYVLNTCLKHAQFSDRFEVGYTCSVWKSARAQAQPRRRAPKQRSLARTWRANVESLLPASPHGSLLPGLELMNKGCAGLGDGHHMLFSLYWFLHSSNNGFATKGWGGLEHTEFASERSTHCQQQYHLGHAQDLASHQPTWGFHGPYTRSHSPNAL